MVNLNLKGQRTIAYFSVFYKDFQNLSNTAFSEVAVAAGGGGIPDGGPPVGPCRGDGCCVAGVLAAGFGNRVGESPRGADVKAGDAAALVETRTSPREDEVGLVPRANGEERLLLLSYFISSCSNSSFATG